MMGDGCSECTVTGQTTAERQRDTVHSTSESFPNHAHPGETMNIKKVCVTVMDNKTRFKNKLHSQFINFT